MNKLLMENVGVVFDLDMSVDFSLSVFDLFLDVFFMFFEPFFCIALRILIMARCGATPRGAAPILSIKGRRPSENRI
ncbi:hypothetical protein [Neisseria bacilliformis]|uniref:hypothetical protein n=1 Tax=Neisseria bacilliformis TaxID=267212 RepID=UPI0028ED82AF|nr:hypothetical protein [Neisseria bacilliformis]